MWGLNIELSLKNTLNLFKILLLILKRKFSFHFAFFLSPKRL